MKKVIILSALLLMPFLFNPALAVDTEIKANSVVSSLGLYGGQPADIAMKYGSENVYLANFAPSGIFYSNNSGESWETLSASTNYGVAKSVEVDQETGDVYALIGDNLLKSTNFGEDFIDLNPETGETNYDHELVIGHDQILVALNDGSVLIGENMGENYTSTVIEADSDILSLAVSPTDNVYFAVTEDVNENDTLYKSTDGGSTWTNMDVHNNGVTSGSRFYIVGVDPLDADHIVIVSCISGNPAYQTTDGGTSWQALSIDGSEISGSYVNFDGTGRMFVSMYYTDDAYADTVDWTMMEQNTPLSFSGFDFLVVDRANPAVLYVGTGLGVAKSIDSGQTWTDQVDGIKAVKTYAFSQAIDKDITWIGANGGVGRSMNFTADEPDWTYPILPDQSIAHWLGVWVNAADPDIVVVAGGTSIFKTENGTDTVPTWEQATAPVINGGQFKQIIADPDDSTLYAVLMDDNLGGDDDGLVLKSEDAGSTWTDLEITDDVPANCITLTEDGILFAGLAGDASVRGIYIMNEDGTWSKPSTDLDDYGITSILADPANADILYATAQGTNSGGFYKSEDQGVNWTKITNGLSMISNFSTVAIQTSTSPDTLYLAGQKNDLNAGVYKSDDAGESWNLLYTGLKQEGIYTLFFDGLITGNDRGLYEIKSRSSLKVNANKTNINKGKFVTITLTLKDKVTNKKLKKKRISVYKKVGQGKWKHYKNVKTNKNGMKLLSVRIKHNTKFKAKWTPNNRFTEEYTGVTSKIVQVRLKK